MRLAVAGERPVMSAPRSVTVLPSGEDYFEHDADIGVVGRGATIEEAFEAAAAATFGIMADLSAVRPERSVALDFEEAARWRETRTLESFAAAVAQGLVDALAPEAPAKANASAPR